MIAGETCCPDKYSQENGSLKSYNSLMRALKILTSHDFSQPTGILLAIAVFWFALLVQTTGSFCKG